MRRSRFSWAVLIQVCGLLVGVLLLLLWPSRAMADTPKASNTSRRPIVPLVDCLEPNVDGTYTAVFGYANPNGASVTIPIGNNNRFYPAPLDQGQPTTFLPGQYYDVFRVRFDGSTLLWVLDGWYGRVSKDSPKCQPPADTPTPTSTDTPLPTPTFTNTPMPVPTDTPTPAPTLTDTPVPTATFTETPLPTPTLTPVLTPTPVATPADIPASTPTPTSTPTVVPTNTPTELPPPTPTPTPTNPPAPTDTPTPAPTTDPRADWLSYTNYYRALAQLPPVTEYAAWSTGAYYHARYMVKNNIIQHNEDPNNPWYTRQGLAAAQSSNLVASPDVNRDHRYALDSWMQAPFHALGIINPALRQVGFGLYREADGGLQMGAALNIIRGVGRVPPYVSFPVKWPADGMTVPLRLHWGEYPNPLTSCPGYNPPTGLPIILQIGPGDVTPNVTAHSFRKGSTALPHCVFDETSYVNPNPADQSGMRGVLDAHDAIVLIPRAPLEPGASYTVSITVNGQMHTWSFRVSETTDQAAGAIPEMGP